ncbi:Uncharacterized protein APZ42_000553 [Daphnia magna]|uniref:Apple domain-containing protein n=1 Tax=Daphnia magna TaxID=35525 RepID=A0A164JJN7_9CRUS|nr:Uncharacterized protein APZ42_000553 [Daphnia magna]
MPNGFLSNPPSIIGLILVCANKVPSTVAKEDTSGSWDVPIINATILLKDLGSTQTVKFVPIALPLDTSAISLNSCIFIYLKTAIVVGIIDPHACSKFCARNSECTHFTNEPLKSGGTSTLHKAPGLGSDWSPPAPQRSGVTCGHMSP